VVALAHGRLGLCAGRLFAGQLEPLGLGALALGDVADAAAK
jgi:hypothetical protein